MAAGVTYTYDGDGRRVKKSSGTLYWFGAGADVLAETNLSGSGDVEHIYFNGQRIARRYFGGKYGTTHIAYYYASDHLGSARVMTTDTGAIAQESDYYPFGGERLIVNNVDNRYKFTGKERDAESGLDYFGARYYASLSGRFMSADEPFIGQSLADPQTFNLYSYVRNNPLVYVDPTGHSPTSTHFNRGPIDGGSDLSGGPAPTQFFEASVEVAAQIRGAISTLAWLNRSSEAAATALVYAYLNGDVDRNGDPIQKQKATAPQKPQAKPKISLKDSKYYMQQDSDSGTSFEVNVMSRYVDYQLYSTETGRPVSRGFVIVEETLVEYSGAPPGIISHAPSDKGTLFKDWTAVNPGQSYTVEQRFFYKGQQVPIVWNYAPSVTGIGMKNVIKTNYPNISVKPDPSK